MLWAVKIYRLVTSYRWYYLFVVLLLTENLAAQTCSWEKQWDVLITDRDKIVLLEQVAASSPEFESCTIRAFIELSTLYRINNPQIEAINYAQRALKAAAKLPDKHKLMAQAWVVHGNAQLHNKVYQEALPSYQQALNLLPEASDNHAKVLLNIAQVWVDLILRGYESDKSALCPACDDKALYHNTIQALQNALEKTLALQQSETQADALLHLAHIAYKLQQSKAALGPVKQAREALLYAQAFNAEKFPRQISHAKAQSGQIYYDAGHYKEAVQLFNQAIFHAQQASALDLLFRWQARLGQAHHALGNLAAAIKAYQQAVDYLAQIRSQLLQFNYYEEANKPLRERVQAKTYLDFIGLLLEATQLEKDNETRQVYLHRILKIQESFKTIELQEYYQDDCISHPQPLKNERNTCLDENTDVLSGKIADDEAVLYPIALPNKLAVLLYRQGQIHTGAMLALDDVNQAVAKANNAIWDFPEISKDNLLKIKNNLAKTQAATHQLYQWLIEPFAKQLEGVQTLIVIPDGELRTIPFSMLYAADAKQYLLEQYAIAVTPSLSLTQIGKRKPLERFFLNGLSVAVDKFGGLATVPREIDNLEALSAYKHTLRDQTFTVKNFQEAARDYRASIAHIATHGVFKGDISQSYLQAYDGRLQIKALENLSRHNVMRGEPVELLTLSACESAKGDERAALGLSGVAVKAGARTALASLWKVNDASTCYLMSRFYQLLQKPMPAAQALRSAQLELLRNKLKTSACFEHSLNYQHPYYWAAFILIGNWM